ncbi:hypothetical protein VP1G_10648 [Cytospora mali]|uniref:Uncharacterized protein n=1 Tax=Cytospora mali TaxID=578113 RepID=A0A194UR84_CYTMA|nr:hypothetical protein VP1G_10648 [Valsa mali var. pyri (nom. inval.)]
MALEPAQSFICVFLLRQGREPVLLFGPQLSLPLRVTLGDIRDERRVALVRDARDEAVQPVVEHVGQRPGRAGARADLRGPFGGRHEELAGDAVRGRGLAADAQLLAEPVHGLEPLERPDDDDLLGDGLAVAHALDEVEQLRHERRDAAAARDQDARVERRQVPPHAARRDGEWVVLEQRYARHAQVEVLAGGPSQLGGDGDLDAVLSHDLDGRLVSYQE